MKKELNSNIKIMSVPVSKSFYERLRKAAFLSKKTISAFARDVLIGHLAKVKKAIDE